MNRRRQLAVVFFSVVIVLVLGAIVLVASLNAGQKTTVFVVTKKVIAGSQYTADNVTTESITAPPDAFSHTSISPTDPVTKYQYALNMNPGDIVRDNDLQKVNQTVQIQLSLAAPSTIVAGDYADVYASYTPGQSSGSAPTSAVSGVPLIAHALLVEGVGSQTATFNIPLRLSPEWVALLADKSVNLYAVPTVPGAAAPTSNNLTDSGAVIEFLASGAYGSSPTK